jgi:hypothetical protein
MLMIAFTINQPINQRKEGCPINTINPKRGKQNQSSNQLINQSTNQPINYSIGGLINLVADCIPATNSGRIPNLI